MTRRMTSILFHAFPTEKYTDVHVGSPDPSLLKQDAEKSQGFRVQLGVRKPSFVKGKHLYVFFFPLTIASLLTQHEWVFHASNNSVTPSWVSYNLTQLWHSLPGGCARSHSLRVQSYTIAPVPPPPFSDANHKSGLSAVHLTNCRLEVPPSPP